MVRFELRFGSTTLAVLNCATSPVPGTTPPAQSLPVLKSIPVLFQLIVPAFIWIPRKNMTKAQTSGVAGILRSLAVEDVVCCMVWERVFD